MPSACPVTCGILRPSPQSATETYIFLLLPAHTHTHTHKPLPTQNGINKMRLLLHTTKSQLAIPGPNVTLAPSVRHDKRWQHFKNGVKVRDMNRNAMYILKLTRPSGPMVEVRSCIHYCEHYSNHVVILLFLYCECHKGNASP